MLMMQARPLWLLYVLPFYTNEGGFFCKPTWGWGVKRGEGWRRVVVDIYLSCFAFSKIRFYTVTTLFLRKTSEQIWERTKTPKAESGKKWTHKGELEGLQLDPLVGL